MRRSIRHPPSSILHPPSALLLVAILLTFPSLLRADSPSLYPSANKRLGFGVTGDIAHYDLSSLNAGWFVNWGTADNLLNPAGLDHAQIIRVGARIVPDIERLRQIAGAKAGSLWLVGNEPDCIWQDNATPEVYARQYHDIYVALKGADPTCQIAIGGVVQATPLRLQWLERVRDAYRRAYGQTLPVDVWNVHNFILQEQRGAWGCDIPPGIDAEHGILYALDQHDDMNTFRSQIVAFRRWMASIGERDKPLIVSEYGILFHEGLGYDYPRVRDFMLASFDYFLSATDPELGYPADGDRLVQRWAWYSLDDASFEQHNYTTWSALYDPFPPYRMRPLGRDFAAYAGRLAQASVAPTPALPTVQVPVAPRPSSPLDIFLTAAVRGPFFSAAQCANPRLSAHSVPPIALLAHRADRVTVTLQALVASVDPARLTDLQVCFHAVRPALPARPLGCVSIPPPATAGTATVSLAWPALDAGAYRVSAAISPVIADTADRPYTTSELSFLVSRCRPYGPLVRDLTLPP